MSGHTPGPWAAYVERHHRTDRGGFSVTADAGEVVICTHACGPYRMEQSSANARLIAVAPDLLESARAVLASIDSGACDDFDALHSLRAAIWKAEGQP